MRRPTLFMGTCRRIRMAWVISKIRSLVHETVHESTYRPLFPVSGVHHLLHTSLQYPLLIISFIPSYTIELS